MLTLSPKAKPQSQLLPEEEKLFPFIKNPDYLHKETSLSQFPEGVQKLVMLDRYSFKDQTLQTLKVGDVVVTEVVSDPKFPTQGYGRVTAYNKLTRQVTVKIDFPEYAETKQKVAVDLENFTTTTHKIAKPLELYWEQICYRVAKGVASVEPTFKLRRKAFKDYFWMLKNQLAIPGGRVLYGAGTGKEVTSFNCFVLPALIDSRRGISRHRETAMEIMSRGGGVGSNGSTLRPISSPVFGVNGKSSGAVSWLGDLANLTHLVEQGGSRRGAQMICLADWHPELIHFIMCKIQNPHVLAKISEETTSPLIKQVAESFLIRDPETGKPITVRNTDFMTGANISILVTDDFMETVEAKGKWTLRFPDLEALTVEQKDFYDREWHNIADVRKWEAMGYPVKEYFEFDAVELYHLINIAARYSAEPGVIFIDHCNDMANSYYYAPIVATNPCGEQPLPPNAVCNLIAINLAKMVNRLTKTINWSLLRKVTRISQRFADAVIDHSYYFLEENEKMAKSERRVGKGVMGLADMAIYLEQPYGSEEMLDTVDDVFEFIKVESYLESANIAEQKGSFPYYDEEKFLQSGFMKTMPQIVIDAIKEKGIRNVCSLTVAPTGSTGTMVGVSTGLEPYYSFTYFRSGRLGKYIEVNTDISQEYFKNNPEAKELPAYFVSAMKLSPLQHANVQSRIQKHVDSAISKTCNAPADFTVEQNEELYMVAWKGGCKGVTVYVDGSRESQVLSLTAEENTFEEETQDQAPYEAGELKDEIEINLESSEKELVAVSAEIKSEISDADLMKDTRTCTIKWVNGVMQKEC